MHPTLSDQQKKTLCADYQADTLVSTLRERHGLSYEEFDTILTEANTPRRTVGRMRRVIDDLTENEIATKYQAGARMRALAVEYDVDRSVIQRVVRQKGLTRQSSYEANQKKVIDRAGVCSDYLDGASANAVAKKHGIGCGAVTRILRHADIELRRKISGRPGLKTGFDEEQIKQIVGLYSGGMSLVKILAQIGSHTSTTQLQKLLVSRNVSIRPKNGQNIQYPCRDDFFGNPHSPEKCYILGWLYTDGYIQEIPRQSITIELKNTERAIVEYIRDQLCPSKPLHDTRKDTSVFSTHCKQIHRDLIGLGLRQAKSLTVQYPAWLWPDLFPHFLQGVIEGDGCVYFGKQFSVSFCGSSPMIRQLAEYVTQTYEIKLRTTTRGRLSSFTTTSNAGAMKLCCLIYRDAPMICARKFKKFQAAFDHYSKRGRMDQATIAGCSSVIADCAVRFSHLLS